MSQTKPTFNAKTTSCAVPLPTGKCVQPMATNKLPRETPTPHEVVNKNWPPS